MRPYLDWSHPFYWFWWGTQVFLAPQTLTRKVGTDSCTLVQECDSDQVSWLSRGVGIYACPWAFFTNQMQP